MHLAGSLDGEKDVLQSFLCVFAIARVPIALLACPGALRSLRQTPTTTALDYFACCHDM